MNLVILKNRAPDGQPLQAIFLPEKGMNLSSYSKGHIEVIDPFTRKDFEDHAGGLGCLIGPHFHVQKKEWIVPLKDETMFPHVAFKKKKGIQDPFPHGIGRYVPWNYKATDRTISASISGRDTWKGTSLSTLEGVDFTMNYEAELTPEGLEISLKVSSDRLSVIGLHYYYALPPGKAVVTAQVQEQYNDMGQFKPMPKPWMKEGSHLLQFDLKEPADYGFLPFLKDFSGSVHLETATHGLRIRYRGMNDEVSWQLYHPQNATFVCIEPMSAKNPRGLTASSSELSVQIEIL
jgi:hypothetical protein